MSVVESGYELISGFTEKEIEEALIQAEKIYGFGLKAIDDGKTEVSENKLDLAKIEKSNLEFEAFEAIPGKTNSEEIDEDV